MPFDSKELRVIAERFLKTTLDPRSISLLRALPRPQRFAPLVRDSVRLDLFKSSSS